MKKYYTNTQVQPNGDHEVHDGSCRYLPGVKNRFYLGAFPSCEGAILRAKNHFDQVNACVFCSPACRTS